MEEENQVLGKNGVKSPDALSGNGHNFAADPNGNTVKDPSLNASQSDRVTNTNEDAKHNSANGVQKHTALSEIDLNSVSFAIDDSSKEWSRSEADTNPIVNSKHVPIMTPDDDDDEAPSHPNIEQVLPEGKEDQEPEDNADAQVGVKKKKKRKPKSKKGLNAPNGFEEYYVDAPLTPAEFEEEKGIYHPSYAFAQRNLDSARKTLFDRYLVHGGVEGGQKMFGGLDATTIATKTSAEIAELSATNYVGGNKGGPGDPTWVVDFEGCLKSFLSIQFPALWDLTSEEMIKYNINIIRNFLNYLLHHDVCPEYKSQINAARAICDKAQRELWSIAELLPLLPGDFNMACSIIFGGMYEGSYAEKQQWMEGRDSDLNAGMSPEQARRIFKMALAANANDAMFDKYRKQLDEKACKVMSTEDTGLEITEILLPHHEALALYAQRQCAGLKTIGKMKARTWLFPVTEDEDLTEDEEAALASTTPEIKNYEFWIEEEVLQKCFVGMKFETKVTHLSFGVSYFDKIAGVSCSFYQMLPNKLMQGWREPEKEWLPYNARRPSGPDVDDDFIQDFAGENGELGVEKKKNKKPAKKDSAGQRSQDESEATKPEAKDSDDKDKTNAALATEATEKEAMNGQLEGEAKSNVKESEQAAAQA